MTVEFIVRCDERVQYNSALCTREYSQTDNINILVKKRFPLDWSCYFVTDVKKEKVPNSSSTEVGLRDKVQNWQP